MKLQMRIAAIGLLLLPCLAACGPKAESPPVTQAEAAPLPPVASPAEEQAFLTRFKAALLEGKVEGIRALGYWQGAQEAALAIYPDLWRSEIAANAKKATRLSIVATDKFSRLGIKMTAPAYAELVLEQADQTTRLPLGVREGRVVLVTGAE